MTHEALAAMLTNFGKYAGVDHVIPPRFRPTYASGWYRRHRDIEGS